MQIEGGKSSKRKGLKKVIITQLACSNGQKQWSYDSTITQGQVRWKGTDGGGNLGVDGS